MDQHRVEDQVRASGQVFKTFRRGRDIGGILRPAWMDPQRAGSQRGRFLGGTPEVRNARWIGRDKEVAPAAKVESVVGFAGELFEDVDAPVHEIDHGIPRPGPPVAVTLGGLVTGQAERGTLVNQNHI